MMSAEQKAFGLTKTFNWTEERKYSKTTCKMNKQEQRIIDAARKVLDNWLYGEISADVSGDFNELEIAFKDYENPSPMDFDWQSFRTEAAKDILCHTLSGGIASGEYDILLKNKDLVDISIGIANELVKRLKEKEEK